MNSVCWDTHNGTRWECTTEDGESALWNDAREANANSGEEPEPFVYDILQIRQILDAFVRRNGRLVVIVNDIRQSKRFIQFDLELCLRSWALCQVECECC